MASISRVPDGWMLVLNDTELQILDQGMSYKPYKDLPGISDVANRLAATIDVGIHHLQAKSSSTG